MLSRTDLVQHFSISLLLILMTTQCVRSLRQIHYTSFKDRKGSYLADVPFDPKQDIYPVIELSSDCPYNPLESCHDSSFHLALMEKFCHLQSKCWNGTKPWCVENDDKGWKDLLLICSPIQKCDRYARNIVKVDRSKPNNPPKTYQLDKEACEDGHYHSNSHDPNDNDCFSSCKKIPGIHVFKERTSNRGPMVYCNYQRGYCNSDQPKLFELGDSLRPCHIAYEQRHSPCRTDFERLPDCTCGAVCEKGYVRDPGTDFKCVNQSDVLASKDILYLQESLKIHQNSSGFRLTLKFPHKDDITIEYVTVTCGGETHSTSNITDDNILVDIEGLFPGNTYTIYAMIMYTYEGQSLNFSLERVETFQPAPVVNLTATFIEDTYNIDLDWEASNGSRQDHYLVEYRKVRIFPKSSWVQRTSSVSTCSLNNTFPGEEYEIRVFSISSGSSSIDKRTGIIVPPLPPKKLQFHFLSPFSTSIAIFWYLNKTRSHVENWRLEYNSSGGEEGRKEVPLPDSGSGNRVDVSFSDFRHGQTYTVCVRSLVGNVSSLKTACIDIKMPEEITKTVPKIGSNVIWYIVIIALLVLGFVAVFYLIRRYRKSTKGAVPNKICYYNRVKTLNTKISTNDGDWNTNGCITQFLRGINANDPESTSLESGGS